MKGPFAVYLKCTFDDGDKTRFSDWGFRIRRPQNSACLGTNRKDLADKEGGGNQKIPAFCERHVWKPP